MSKISFNSWKSSTRTVLYMLSACGKVGLELLCTCFRRVEKVDSNCFVYAFGVWKSSTRTALYMLSACRKSRFRLLCTGFRRVEKFDSDCFVHGFGVWKSSTRTASYMLSACRKGPEKIFCNFIYYTMFLGTFHISCTTCRSLQDRNLEYSFR